MSDIGRSFFNAICLIASQAFNETLNRFCFFFMALNNQL